MKTERLEAWVLSIVDDVAAGRRVEDSRVELKADWPDPKRAARRLAGHANAAGSDSILWVVGLDEATGVAQLASLDIATWLPQITAEFEGVAPTVKDLVVPTGSGPVTALLFDASRRPFVVRNPVFGQSGGGPVSLEVPWRRGTAVESARRDELLRLLALRQASPHVEFLGGMAQVDLHGPPSAGYGEPIFAEAQRSQHLAWSFHLTLYVTPPTTDLLVLPTHKAVLTFTLQSDGPKRAVAFRFYAPYSNIGSGSRLDSSTVTASEGEAVFRGPGLVHARASHYEGVRALPSDAPLLLRLAVSPAGGDSSTEVVFTLQATGEQAEHKRHWRAETEFSVT